MGIKKLEDRIADAVSIRKQLKSMGVLVIPEILEKIKVASDDFINNAVPSKVILPLPFEKTKIEVMFVVNEQKQSGISVIQ